MNANPDIDLQFGPDFSGRVLEAADRLVARRRRIRWIAGASMLCAGIGAVGVWLGFPAVSQGPAQSPDRLLAADGAAAPSRSGAQGALSWLFPDAEPLARYAADDASDESDDGATALFMDDD